MDGIKCFDLNNSDLGGEDLRMSIEGRQNIIGGMDANESLMMWAELEKLKRENEELMFFKLKVERENCNFGSNLGMVAR